MNHPENGIIEFAGVKKTRPILSHVRHRIEKWIEREQSLLFLPKHSDYRARLGHDPDTGAYTCQILINIGSRQWFGFESARTLPEAIDRTLHHMRSQRLLVRELSELATA